MFPQQANPKIWRKLKRHDFIFSFMILERIRVHVFDMWKERALRPDSFTVKLIVHYGVV